MEFSFGPEPPRDGCRLQPKFLFSDLRSDRGGKSRPKWGLWAGARPFLAEDLAMFLHYRKHLRSVSAVFERVEHRF